MLCREVGRLVALEAEIAAGRRGGSIPQADPRKAAPAAIDEPPAPPDDKPDEPPIPEAVTLDAAALAACCGFSLPADGRRLAGFWFGNTWRPLAPPRRPLPAKT